MRTSRRVLSVLLATIMAFGMISVAIPVATAAVPIVPRVADQMPTASFVVPATIYTYGDNEAVQGNNVKTQTKAISFFLTGATNITLNSTSNITVGSQVVENSTTYWNISGGTAVANQYVTFYVTYTYNGKGYTSYGYSWVETAHHVPSVEGNIMETKTGCSRDVDNYHVLYFSANDNAAANKNIPLTLNTEHVYGTGGNGKFDYSTKSYASGYTPFGACYQWYSRNDHQIDSCSGSDHVLSESSTPVGTYYFDVNAYENLQSSPLTICSWSHSGSLDSNHFKSTKSYVYSAMNGSTNVKANYSTTVAGEIEITQKTTPYVNKISGPKPAAGETLTIVIEEEYWSQGKTVVMFIPFTASQTSYVRMKINIIGVDKSALKTKVNSERVANRQQQYYSSASWTLYQNAYSEAYATMQNPQADQAAINSKLSNLNSAIGSLTLNPADYSTVDNLLQRVPTDFSTHPEYYTAATAQALSNAIADIAYDRTLTMNYQNVVDQMATNLSNALDALTLVNGTISFDSQGGTSVPSITNKLKTSVSEPSTVPYLDNYTFKGWYYDDDCTNPVLWPIQIPYGGATLYAKWEPKLVKITFNTNGGSAIPVFEGFPNTQCNGPTAVSTKPGYNSPTWYRDGAFTTLVSWPITLELGRDITLYAKWDGNEANFNLNFNRMDGSSVSTLTPKYKDSVPKPTDPVLTSFGFAGWYYEPEYTTLVTWPLTMPANNLTLYAKWTPGIYKYTFDSQGGSAVANIEQTVGTPFTPPANPTKPGYDFGGWLYGGLSYTFPGTMPGMDISLVAKWNPKTVTISFNTDGGTIIAPKSGLVGTAVPKITAPEKSGYLFDHWELNGSSYTIADFPTTDITLVAKYITMPDRVWIKLKTSLPEGTTVLKQGDSFRVTVNMKTNFITASSSVIIFYDSTYFEPSMNGLAYGTSQKGTTAFTSGFLTSITRSTVAAPYVYSDTVGTWDGAVNNADVSPYYPAAWRNASVVKPEFAHYKYIHAGMTTLLSAPSAGNLVIVNPAADVFSFELRVKNNAPITTGTQLANIIIPTAAMIGTFPAHTNKLSVYKNSTSQLQTGTPSTSGVTFDLTEADLNFEIQARTTSKLTFDARGGSPTPTAIDVGIGENVPANMIPASPTKANCDFLGWETNDGIYINWDTFTMPSSNMTIYARWSDPMANYTVNYFRQNLTATGYNLYESQTPAPRGVVGALVTGTQKTYPGFTYNSDMGNNTVVVLANGTATINMYYDRNLVTMSFITGGGTTISPISNYFDSTYTKPSNPTKTGYTFTGWNVPLPDKIPATNTTYTAQWAINYHDVTFKVNGVVVGGYPKSVKFGDPIPVPTISVPAGQVLSSWSPAVPSTMPDEELVFTATMSNPKYTVTYYLSGTQWRVDEYEEGQTIASVTPPLQTGEYFSGWAPALPSTMGTQSLIVSGSIRKKTYVIEIYLDGILLHEYSLNYNDVIDASELPDLDIPGFNTVWSEELPARMPDYAVSPHVININYEPVAAPEYTVALYVDGVLFNSTTGQTGTSIVKPTPAPGYSGFTWSPSTPPDTIGAANATYYATSIPINYTISFTLNGTAYGTPITQAYKSAINAVTQYPTVTVPQGYVFSGWSPVYTQMPLGNQTVTATLTKTTSKVIYNLNGGTGTTPAEVWLPINSTVALPAQGDIAKNGYNFLGWATTSGATTPATTITVPATDDLVIYAVWQQIQVAPTLVGRQGSTIQIKANNTIMGLKPGITVSEFENQFAEVQGNGHLEYSSSPLGTGVIVSLIDNANGNTVATYTIIIFGDLDGNGVVNNQDFNILSLHAKSKSRLPAGSPQLLAADVDQSGIVNQSDISTMNNALSGKAVLSQTRF